MYTAQLEVVKTCLNKQDKYVILNGSRQVGKSFILSVLAIFYALEQKGQHIMVVSPTDSQVKKLYKQIIQMLSSAYSVVIKSNKIQSGDSEIIFKNNSVILFRSAASEDSLRGYSNTHLLLDECAFIKEDTWNTILAQTLTVRGKKAFFCSTPKGKNFFYKLYSRGISGTPSYKSFKITFHQNPYANQEFINQQMQILPSDIFAQEYLGEFVDATGVFKDIDVISILNKQPAPAYGKQYSIGVDIAFKKDYTVAVCIDQDGNMVDYIRFNQTDTGVLLNNLKTFFNKWKARKIVIEENNQGIPVIDMLRREGITNINNFQTNPKSKNELINKFMAAINNKEVKLLNEEVIKEEFKAFTYNISPSGNVTFSASFGHDDIVMATAFAFQGLIENRVSKVVFM